MDICTSSNVTEPMAALFFFFIRCNSWVYFLCWQAFVSIPEILHPFVGVSVIPMNGDHPNLTPHPSSQAWDPLSHQFCFHILTIVQSFVKPHSNSGRPQSQLFWLLSYLNQAAITTINLADRAVCKPDDNL